MELLQQKCFCSVWSAGPQSPSVLGPNNKALSLAANVTFTYCDSKTGTTKKKKNQEWPIGAFKYESILRGHMSQDPILHRTHTRVEKLMRRVQE